MQPTGFAERSDRFSIKRELLNRGEHARDSLRLLSQVQSPQKPIGSLPRQNGREPHRPIALALAGGAIGADAVVLMCLITVTAPTHGSPDS